ncbi:MAG: hypothetical protein ABJT31_01920 [Hyphomicrobiales bacterium]
MPLSTGGVTWFHRLKTSLKNCLVSQMVMQFGRTLPLLLMISVSVVVP